VVVRQDGLQNKLLLSIFRSIVEGKLQNAAGTEESNILLDKYKVCSVESSASSDGSDPLKLFVLRSNRVNAPRPPIAAGNVPDTLFPFKLRAVTRAFVQVTPVHALPPVAQGLYGPEPEHQLARPLLPVLAVRELYKPHNAAPSELVSHAVVRVESICRLAKAVVVRQVGLLTRLGLT
jgi:hypothetical protein